MTQDDLSQISIFQDNFFEGEKNTPIFFVDVSGSTDSVLYQHDDKRIRVRDYEFELIAQESQRLSYEMCHVCCWSSEGMMFKNVNPLDKNELTNIKNSIKKIISGTEMMSGFNLVTDDMFHPDKTTDFIILTDGEINDSAEQIDQTIRELSKKNVTIRIIAIELGKTDYMKRDCSVGNTLFRYIRECNMTRVVNSFSIYNSLQKEFVNFYNPRVPDGYAPYIDNTIFKKSEFKQFMIFIDSELKSKKEQYDLLFVSPDPISPDPTSRQESGTDDSDSDEDEDKHDGEENENRKRDNTLKEFRLALTRFTHSLSLSIYHCIEDKPYHEQMGIIGIFCNMYQIFPADSGLYQMARQLLIDEVNNHISGRATTFTDAKKKRHLDIENTNIDLMSDVRKAITDKNPNSDTDRGIHEMYNSFIIRSDNDNIVVRINSRTQLKDLALDKVHYRESCVSVHNYSIPLMFRPEKSDNCVNSSIQWIRTLYSRTLNISPSNPNIWYYLAIDGIIGSIATKSNNSDDLRHVSDQYFQTVQMFLNEKIFGTEIKLIDRYIENEKIDIDYGTVCNGSLYSRFGLSGLSLFYLIAHRYVYSQITDQTKKYSFIKSALTYCSKDISHDLGSDQNIVNNMSDFDMISDMIIEKIGKVNINMFDLIQQDIHITDQHTITGTSIVCPQRVVPVHLLVCDICSSAVRTKTIMKSPNDHINTMYSLMDRTRLVDGEFKPHIVNIDLFSDLGMMDGESTDTCLLSPRHFASSDEYMTCKNTMIIDPISSTRMRITSQEAFLKRVADKYPFLKDILTDNVVLAGGFVRSILCRQEMKDFDFFFNGLESDEQYIDQFNQTVINLINGVRRFYAKQKINVKFGMFFKPMFNVFELICFEDPSDHINESFDLSSFHSYKFHSLKQYVGDVKRPEKVDPDVKRPEKVDPDVKRPEKVDPDAKDSEDDKPYDRPHENKNDKYYFEDNDERGIRMRHRFQFILCKYDSKFDIVNSFDMFPSKVLFDGKQVYFTDKSLRAYQYMINEIMLDGGSALFKHRLSKYFKYGFSIVFPPNQRDWNAVNHSNNYNLKDARYDGIDENKGPLSFKIRKTYDNIIIISHNSNIEKMLERNETLEVEAKGEGKGLYISSLFCSFVSILRYVDINGIDYLFPNIKSIEFPDNNDEKSEPNIIDLTLDNVQISPQGIRFKDNTVMVEFKDRFSTLYKDRQWFDLFHKSMILTDY
jgi:hypothetical protein